MRAVIVAALACAVFTVGARAAAAEGVGVVVTGEAALQPPLVAQLEGWLRSHGHEVVALALDPPAINTLVDCFTVDDSGCARRVIEKRSRANSVVFARVTREGQVVSLTVHWITKGKPPSGVQRGCEDCSVEVVRGAADELMVSLAATATAATGRLKVTSQPAGLFVLLDGVKIGVTPIEREIATGVHSIALIDGITRVGERDIKIEQGVTAEVTVPVRDPRAARAARVDHADLVDHVDLVVVQPSRAAPIALMVGGLGAIAAGGGALYLGSRRDPDWKTIYPDATPIGVALVGAGAVAIGAGIWLWRRGTRESVPVVAVFPGGAQLAWQRRF